MELGTFTPHRKQSMTIQSFTHTGTNACGSRAVSRNAMQNDWSFWEAADYNIDAPDMMPRGSSSAFESMGTLYATTMLAYRQD